MVGIAKGGESFIVFVCLCASVAKPLPESSKVGGFFGSAERFPGGKGPIGLPVEGAPQVGAVVQVGLHVDVYFYVEARRGHGRGGPARGDTFPPCAG